MEGCGIQGRHPDLAYRQVQGELVHTAKDSLYPVYNKLCLLLQTSPAAVPCVSYHLLTMTSHVSIGYPLAQG